MASVFQTSLARQALTETTRDNAPADNTKIYKKQGGWVAEDRGQHVGLVEFTQPSRFGWLRVATPTLRNYAKICKKKGGWGGTEVEERRRNGNDPAPDCLRCGMQVFVLFVYVFGSLFLDYRTHGVFCNRFVLLAA